MEMAFKFMLMLMMTFLTLFLAKTSNPFMGSLTLVILTMMLMLDVSFLVSQWVAYLLMLLFLGGMMVMFLYVTSVMTTLKFNLPNMSNEFILVSVFVVAVVFMVKPPMLSSKFISLSDFFNMDSAIVVMFTFFYLLIALVTVVTISKKFVGSLKSKIND
uniref:NADH dehydrogenase subunit 6 n=1 Tax=Sinergasilus polycolpus TaxID=232557 RepID=C1INF4_SINPO|nr:NADH dehydrogenase subunit 6 [Sinergasilus polycolpus]ACB99583.1 NADH dehydrogenase subunit 6 [Sinergasilus polycolpus]ALG63358.1 NADH dehydrogenase subunit 6 [Sinergasilus polycolpus]